MKNDPVARLRLHNNLTCGIVIKTATATEINPVDGKVTTYPPGSSLAPVLYRVQEYRRTKAPRQVPDIPLTDIVFSTLIPPGRSVAFGVPLRHFKKGLHVVVPFGYVWEGAGEQSLLHQVYFLRDMLPERAWEGAMR